ncbi:immunoglobulin-like domain-containing protein [Paenibacillus dendritiformis]|uniref:immunoglobulin-like domain-containing protein n=1 Tax=Paenibacillus dendritiformis TaxID=130049 RepID=UPI003648DB40
MRKQVILMLLCIALSACGGRSGPAPAADGIPSAAGANPAAGDRAAAVKPHAAEPAIAALTETAGRPDALRASSRLPRDIAIAAADEYQPQTGKWFTGDGFNLISSLPSGDIQAGSEATVGLKPLPDGRSCRLQLTSRDQEGKRLELLAEQTAGKGETDSNQIAVSFRMPEQPDANYVLSIEMLSPESEVEDTLLVPLFVPPNEVNARLAVNSPPEGSRSAAMTLYNAGPADLQLGYGYELYRAEDEDYVPVPFTQAVPAIGIHIEPGGTFDETITLPRGLESGRYRVVKRFSAFLSDKAVDLAADFEIQ